MNSGGLIVWWLRGAFRLRETLPAMLRCRRVARRVDDFRAINAITLLELSMPISNSVGSFCHGY
jgi:hypothetical protein